MNTKRNTARRLEEQIINAGVPPHGYQVPPVEQDVNDDQAPVNPPPLNDENIRAALFKMAQAINTKEQSATTQALVMTAQANLEVVPRAHQ